MLQLNATLRLRHLPESQLLGDLLATVLSDEYVTHGTAGEEYRIRIAADCTLSDGDKTLFLDVLRAIDPLLVETIHLRGQLGDAAIDGYLGPDKNKKETSRSRLEEIRKQVDMLLPEHKAALWRILGDA
jgi:hypothetical protein